MIVDNVTIERAKISDEFSSRTTISDIEEYRRAFQRLFAELLNVKPDDITIDLNYKEC